MKYLLPAITLTIASTTNLGESAGADLCGFHNCNGRERCEFLSDDNGKAVYGAFTVYNNKGQDYTIAEQCTGVDWSEGSSIAWHTSYSVNDVDTSLTKSFAVVSLEIDQKKLKSIQSIPTEMTYNYTSGGDMVSNVLYDMFTATYGDPQIEVMVWVAAYGGAEPWSTTDEPIKTVTLCGVEFDLYEYDDYSRNLFIYTFVASTPATTFKGDLKTFFSEIPEPDVPFAEQYLLAVSSGAQAFKGTDVKLAVSNLTLSVQ